MEENIKDKISVIEENREDFIILVRQIFFSRTVKNKNKELQ